MVLVGGGNSGGAAELAGERGDEEQDGCSSPDPDRIGGAMAGGAAWGTPWTLDYDPMVLMIGSGVWGELGGG